MVAASFMEAICSLLGSAIGANRINRAKRLARLTLVLSYVSCMCVVLLLFANRTLVARAFTKDAGVEDLVARLIPFLCINAFTDVAQALLSGVVRALGKQSQAAKFVLAAYYCIGIPVGLLCAFWIQLEVKGLWYGLILGTTFQALAFVRVILTTDWYSVAKQATDAIKASKTTAEMVEVETSPQP